MKSSATITLFSERPELNQQPYTFVVSVLMHGVVFGLLFLGIYFSPKIKAPSINERYALRHLDLHTLEAEMQRALERSAEDSSFHPPTHIVKPGGGPASPTPVLRQLAQAHHGSQTLIQPDIPKPIPLPNIPLPTVVIWNGSKTPVVKLAPPLPQPPVFADVKPSIERPTLEPRPADIAIPASILNLPKQPILASTTVPLVLSGPKPTEQATITTAQGSAQSTPAAVMSLSNSNMPEGSVLLPPANESAASDSWGLLAPGHATDPSGNGDGTGTGRGSGNGASGGGGDSGSGLGNKLTSTTFKRQKTGQFGAVVVGSSLGEKYPETADLWGGRLSYTVYMPVGLTKSWILQFSLSRDEGPDLAGTIARIEAPWPFSIVRPNIAPGVIEADALMVHGFVNQAGHFEELAVVFPPAFPMAQFVLDSLAQWQFRPATQNGKSVKVEVLLIIPEESE
jgi:hypothetical protein